jgi:hypothetical protein
MWLSAMILVGLVLAGAADASATSVTQDCVIVGEVGTTPGQLSANLFSNCPLRVERKARLLIIKGRHRNIEVRVPESPGLHDFVYRWGQRTAQIGDQDVEIAFGPAGET